MSKIINEHPKVFISYSHDSPEHANRVLALSDRLRSEGIDTILDQYEVSPSEGWPKWMHNSIHNAKFVLVVCTETYFKRVMDTEDQGKGKGVKWESTLVYQDLYDADSKNTKYIPILFNDCKEADIPRPLMGATRYQIESLEGYDKLYRHLTNQPATLKPALGKLKELAPKDRKTDFFSTPAFWYMSHMYTDSFTGRKDVPSVPHERLNSEDKAAPAQSATNRVAERDKKIRWYKSSQMLVALIGALAVLIAPIVSHFLQRDRSDSPSIIINNIIEENGNEHGKTIDNKNQIQLINNSPNTIDEESKSSYSKVHKQPVNNDVQKTDLTRNPRVNQLSGTLALIDGKNLLFVDIMPHNVTIYGDNRTYPQSLCHYELENASSFSCSSRN